jgi:hypothetical protein
MCTVLEARPETLSTISTTEGTRPWSPPASTARTGETCRMIGIAVDFKSVAVMSGESGSDFSNRLDPRPDLYNLFANFLFQ